ncbi:hypothetical protein DFH28DRAFT_892543, partial [Melampsora americana]
LLKSAASGTNKRRFYNAMEEHVTWLKVEGSKFVEHVCSLCTEVKPIPNSKKQSEQHTHAHHIEVMRATVTNGITIGFWCCSVSELQLKSLDPQTNKTYCDNPLKKVKHQYCPSHHNAFRNIFQEREHKGARDGGTSRPPKKVLISQSHGYSVRHDSSTEDILQEWIKEVFPKKMPQVIFYDNACGLYSHIQGNCNDAYHFRNTLLPVDAFHICSHKESHTTCRLNNYPHLFPYLKQSEMVNSWFGQFDPMCQNMSQIKYEFFLEGMILLHNSCLAKNLSRRSNVLFLGNTEYTKSPLNRH